MDFQDVPDTEEMRQFRQEVRTWLEENVPDEMRQPVDQEERNEERYWFWREKHKELGAKGWFYATFPKEYGGGGLTAAHETILKQEFGRARAGSLGGGFLVPSLLVWATEEQKQKFLVPLLKGQARVWQKYTEPHSGSDLASYVSRAVRDGDDWLLTGSNAFPGGKENDSGWYYGPMLTDPDAPRHRNLGFFMIPYPSPGLEFKRMRAVQGTGQCFIFLDNVRVPGDHLIGGDHQGWQVTNTGLEQEHGGTGGQVFRARDVMTDSLVRYMQERRQNGEIADPEREKVIQQTTVEAHIEERLDDIFTRKVAWMYHNRIEMTWEGPTSGLFQRHYTLRNVSRVRDVMGMHTLLSAKEARAPYGGVEEVNQRTNFILQHGAGSLNIAKVVTARRIGISRTRERAAPTPMTATTTSSSG